MTGQNIEVKIMKALFLAGGLGTRLRPLTDRLPKPMVPVMGKPLLERSFEELKLHDVNEIVLSTCYKPESIERYFKDGNSKDLLLHYVCEDVPLGTGGAIKNAEQYFDEPFLIFNADIISDINFREMIRFHKRKKADVTIAVTRVEDPTAYGVIEYDDNDFAITFKEKPKPHEVVSHYINAGVYIFQPDILKRIPSGRPVSVEREVFPKLLEIGKRIAIYRGCNYWLDLGTPEKYIQVHQDAFSGKYRILDTDFKQDPVYGSSDARIHETAVIHGPVYIGDNVRIEAGVEIGPNVVVGDGCFIGKKADISNSILWNDVKIGQNAKIRNTIVVDNVSIKNNSRYANIIYTENAVRRLVNED